MSVLTFAVDLKTKNEDTVFNRLHMKVNITCPTVLFPTILFLCVAIEKQCLSRTSYWKGIKQF